MPTPPPDLPVMSLESINELIPKLNVLVGEQLRRRAAIEARLEALSKILGHVPENVAIEPSDSPTVRDIKEELSDRIAEYQQGWRTLETMGGTVKDARLGLIDFYGRLDGKLVWLCWRYGETEVTHYHALDDGYNGRREIRDSAKMRLIN